MEHLSSDIRHHITKHLSNKDLERFPRVCKNWNEESRKIWLQLVEESGLSNIFNVKFTPNHNLKPLVNMSREMQLIKNGGGMIEISRKGDLIKNLIIYPTEELKDELPKLEVFCLSFPSVYHSDGYFYFPDITAKNPFPIYTLFSPIILTSPLGVKIEIYYRFQNSYITKRGASGTVFWRTNNRNLYSSLGIIYETNYKLKYHHFHTSLCEDIECKGECSEIFR